MIPLPASTPNSSAYSFINSPFSYLLLSTTKSHYSRLKDLSACKNLSTDEYICERAIIYLTAERPVCETLLKSPIQRTNPFDCPTKTFKAHMEVWHRLSANSRLFVMSQKGIASVNCDNSKSAIYDVELEGTGIFNMRSRCKCYTLSTVLLSSSNKSSEHIGYQPIATVLEDESV